MGTIDETDWTSNIERKIGKKKNLGELRIKNAMTNQKNKKNECSNSNGIVTQIRISVKNIHCKQQI